MWMNTPSECSCQLLTLSGLQLVYVTILSCNIIIESNYYVVMASQTSYHFYKKILNGNFMH